MRPETSGDSASIRDEAAAFVLGRDGDRWSLASVTDGMGEQLVNNVGRLPMWTIRGRSAEGEMLECSSDEGRQSVLSTSKRGLKIEWTELGIGSSTCSATVGMRPAGPGTIAMGLDLAFDPPFRLWEVEFPRVGGLVSDGARLITPYGYGKETAFDEKTSYKGRYPSHHCAMQLLAWTRRESSLYLGCHDSRAMTKELGFKPEPSPHFQVLLPVPGQGTRTESFKMPYPTVLGVIPGGWYDLATSYRKWATAQRWANTGPTVPEKTCRRLAEVALWCQCGGPPEEVTPKILEFAEFFDVPTAVHWYIWHEIPFDDRYPEYFPPKPGFEDAVRTISETGTLVMPYINARLWDPKTDSWAKEGAENAATRDHEMKPYTETYASKVPLTPMCPSTRLWRRKVLDIVSRLADQCRVDGVYLDQIAAAAPKLCHDPGHGHDLGGGGWWVEGYRKLLRSVRARTKKINPDFFLTTESNAEPWIDLLDGLLMCNSTEGDLVPLFPAVYSDRALTFGAYIFRTDLEDSNAFRVKVSQMFLWGTQLGWLGFDVLEPKFAHEAEYLRALARVRAQATVPLTGAALLRPPPPDPEVEVIEACWNLWNKEWRVRMPAAQATFWRAADGSILALACNAADSPACLKTSITLADLGLSRSRGERFARSGFPGADACVSADRLELVVALQPRSATWMRSSLT